MSDDLSSIVGQAVESAATQEVQGTESVATSEPTQPENSTNTQDKTDQVDAKEQDGEEEEKFTKVNPNDLPEELKAVYKSLQRDYTKKRMTEAQEKKELQARLQQLEESLSQYSQPQQQQQNAQPVGPHAGMSVEEYTQYLLEQSKQATLQELQQMEEQKQIQKETENLQNIQTEYFSSDPRLDPDSSDYDEVLSTYISNKMQEKLTKYVDEKGTSYGFETEKVLSELVNGFEERMSRQVAQKAKQNVQASIARDAKARKQSSVGVGSISTMDKGGDLRSILEQVIS